MQDMQKSVEAEGQKEKEFFENFMCYCNNGAGSLDASIQTTAAAIESLIGMIASEKAQKSQAEQAEEEDARHDWREYLAREGDDEGFEFIAAPEECLQIAREIMAKQSQFKGGRKDVDLLEEEMNPEEKAVFAVLDGSDDEANDEVDDDYDD